MSLDTSAESPVPVRTVLQLVGGWLGRLGRVWVEGQIAECAVRGNAVFLTLRDPIAAVSVRVICSRQVFDAAEPTPADGARVVIWARPDFNAHRGAVCSPGWRGCAASWPQKGFFPPDESAFSLSCQVSSG